MSVYEAVCGVWTAEIRGGGFASWFEGSKGKHDIELSVWVHITLSD